MKRWIQLLLAAMFMTAAPARQVDACECMEVGPPCQAAWSVDAVFAGTVRAITEIAQPPYRSYAIRFDVERSFRNAAAGPSEIFTSGSTCGYQFTIGRRYLVYASKRDGKLTTSICSRTRPLDKWADEDVRYLSALPVSSTGARVFGRIRQIEWDPGPEVMVDYGPLEGLRVYVTGSAFARETLTDDDGRYEIPGVPLGTYRIGVVVPPEFESRSLEREFEVKDVRACVQASFDTRWEARISGVVIDEAGRPVEGVTVEAIPEEHAASPPRPYARPEDRTDASGSFELVGVAPARYVIAITLKPDPATGRAAPVRVFFPGTRSPGEAAVVEVSAGDRRELGPFRFVLAEKR